MGWTGPRKRKSEVGKIRERKRSYCSVPPELSSCFHIWYALRCLVMTVNDDHSSGMLVTSGYKDN